MTAPIALQLYSIRDVLNEDFSGTIKKVAQMGYVGVETAGFPGTTPAKAAVLFKELGLQVCATHTPAPLGDAQDQTLRMMADLGAPRLVIPWQPPDLFDNKAGIQKVADILNESHEIGKSNGFSVGYHNHWGELRMVENRPALAWLLDLVAPEVFFEIDCYWVEVGGVDPVELVRQFGKRAPLLHIKDGSAVQGEPMVAVGDGTLDYHDIIGASQENAEWLIVELDKCATDVMEAVAKSQAYLTREGLAHGKA